MFEFVHKDKLYKFIFYFMLFFFTFFVLRGSVLNSDDLYFNFLISSDIKLKYEFIYGTWIMPLQNLLMYYLPYKFGVSLQLWAISFGVLFETTITVFLIYTIMKFCNKNISFPVYSLIAILAYFMYFIFLEQRAFIDLLLYSGFFRFILPSLFLLIVTYFIYKLHIDEKVNIPLTLILSFIAAASSELVATLLIMICLCSLIFKIIVNYSLKNSIVSKSYLKWILILFSSFFGFAFLYFSAGFQLHLHLKTPHLLTFSGLCESFIPFCICFFKHVLAPYWIVYLAVSILSLFYIKNNKSISSYNVVSFPAISILSFFCVSFSLILLGKTSYKHNFWLDHEDIYSIFIPLLILSIVIILSYSISSLSKYKQQFLSLFIIALFSLSIPFALSIDKLRGSITTIAKYTYIRDKIRLFYSHKGLQPYSSLYLFSRPAWIQTRNFPFKESEQVIYYAKVALDDYYYPLTYKHHIYNYSKEYIFLDFYQLLDKFEKDGGSLIEVLVNDYDFSKLQDKYFVLYKPS